MTDKKTLQLTLIKKENGLLTKRIYRENGELKKDSSQCRLTDGTAEIKTIMFHDFPKFIRSLQKNECIVHGIFDDEKYGKNGIARIVTKKTKESLKDDNTTIARSKDYFSYPESNAIVMFDYDVDDQEDALTIDEYIEVMSSIIPGFDECAKVITYSTSSFIYDQDGNLLSGKNPSFHLYFYVDDSRDIPRFKDVLFKKCWLAGHGKIKVGKNKNVLVRTIFDKSVFSPERIDFIAGAECEDGLIQKLPKPEYYYGGSLDTSLLVDLTPEEEIAYQRKVQKAKEPFLNEYERYKEERINKTCDEKGWNKDKATNYITDFDDRILWNEQDLLLDDGRTITVKELLDDGKKYDGVTMADPWEPEKGRNKAKFYWNNGEYPQIHSFIRGERVFSFKKYEYKGGRPTIELTDKKPTFGALDDFVDIDQARGELEDILTSFFRNKIPVDQMIIMDAGIGKTRGFMRALSHALKQSKRLYEIQVAYFIPDNELSNELISEYYQDNTIVGMPAMIRGRGHFNDKLNPPCTIANGIYHRYQEGSISLEDYHQKVGMINSQFCKTCSITRENCEYFRQFSKAKAAHIIFMPHKYLFTMSEELKEIASIISHVIVDEDIVASNILDNTEGVCVFSCDRTKSEVVRGIIDDIEHGAEMGHVLCKWKDQIEDEYSRHKNIKKLDAPSGLQELNSDEYSKQLVQNKVSENKRTFWKLLKNAAQDAEIYIATSLFTNCVWVDGNTLKVGRKQKINSLWFSGKKRFLYMDASAEPDIVKAATGRTFNVNRIRTKYHQDVEVIQIYDNMVTSSYLEKNYTNLFESLKVHFGGKIPPFITSKKIEDLVKKDDLVLPDHKTGHFRKIRGTDTFKDDEKLLVIGRYQINPTALEEKARLLYPYSTNPLDYTRNYQDFVYRMADGRNMSTRQNDYAIFTDIWKLNNHLSRSETEQAIARIRPFDVTSGKKKIVYVLTSQVLDVTVNRLVPISDYLMTKPKGSGKEVMDRLLGHINDNKGILLWKPKKISEATGLPVTSLNSV